MLKSILAAAAIVTMAVSVPVRAVPPLSLYGRLPGIERVAISASGEHLAILGIFLGKRQLVILDARSKPLVRAEIGDKKVRGLEWAGDQSVLVTYSDTVGLGYGFAAAKAELSSVLVIPAAGSGKPWVVFAGDDSIQGGVRGNYGVLQRDNHWYGYYGGITLQSSATGKYLESTQADLYEVDLSNGHKHKIGSRLEGDGLDRDWLVDSRGEVGASMDFDHTSGSWKIFNSARHIIASGIHKLGGVQLSGFTPDGSKLLYFLSSQDGTKEQWFIVPLAGGTPQAYLDTTTVRSVLRGRGSTILGYVGEDQATTHFFSDQHARVYRGMRRAFPNVTMSVMDYDDAFDQLIVQTEGPGDPMTWWKVDIHTGDANEIGLGYPMISADVAPMKMVPFKAADGLSMEGVLTLPPGTAASNLPAVMLPHGGPAAYDEIGFDWMAQALASRGYAVFQPNFRGSTGYGTALELAGHGEWGRKMQTDISDGLAELVRQGIVDPKRVCIMGASYGGYAALAGVTLQQGIYRCAVSIAGVANVARMRQDDVRESGFDPLLRRALDEEIGSGRSLKDISPVNFASRVQVPVLLIHGKDDTVVSYSQSTEMLKALRDANKQVDLVTLPGEDHWLSSSATRQTMLEAAVGFIQKHNPVDARH